MSPGRCLLLAALLALAGCNAVPFGASEEPTPPETLTAVPVETQTEQAGTATAAAPSPPPGVSNDGTVNVRRLRSAHDRYVDAVSYTWVLTYDANATGEGMLDRQFTRIVTVEGDRFHAEQFGPATSVDQSLYVEGATGYQRVGTDNGSEFDATADPGDHTAYAIGGELLWRYLSGVNLSVDVVDHDGQTYYRIYAVDGKTPVALRGFSSNVQNYRVTVYVTPGGLARTLIVEYDRTSAGNHQHVTVRFDYNDVGETSVSRPDWVDQVTPPASQTPTLQPPSTTETLPPPERTDTPPSPTETATSGENRTT